MRHRRLPFALAACMVVTGWPALPLHAQTGAGGNPLDQLPAPPTVDTTPGKARSGIDAPSPPLGPASQEQAGSIAVTPLRFQIEGVQSISFDAVAALFAPLAGKPTTVAALTALARQVTAMYQQRGYALSFGYIPQQDFRDGVVRVVAVEGFVATVKIEGEAGPAAPKLLAMAERIQRDRPLTLASFERYTQLMAQMPGLRVEARAVPSASTDGAGTLVLKVTRQPYSLSVGTDFRSSRPRAVITGVLNDPVAAGGRLSTSVLAGALRGESYGAASYSHMVGNDGLTLKAEVSRYSGNPDAQLATPPTIERHTTYQRAELSAQYPLMLKRTESLTLAGGVYGVNNVDDYRVAATGLALADKVNTRVLYAQVGYNTASEEQAQKLTLRLAHGLKGLGAQAAITANVPGTLPASQTKLDFTRLLLEGSQHNRWGKQWGTAVSFAGQYSADTLPSTERVSFGGTRFARAYSPGEAAGDSGWGLGLELNRSFALGMTYLKQLQPYVLLEKASVRNRIGTPALSSLTSASLGLRLTDLQYYNLDIAVSKPTGDASPVNPARKLRLSALVSYSLERR